MRSFLIISLTLISTSLFAQNKAKDLLLIGSYEPETAVEYYNDEYGNDALFVRSKRTGFISYTLGGLMFLYQNLVSPQMSSGCQYQLSCSNFSKQAIHEFGWLKGVMLSADRLMRCNSMSLSEHPQHLKTSSGVVDEPGQYRFK
ncbi:MAG: membrane protein insertion efficiency factor YidD [Bacteroidetes bacterium]|nr:membrane protein insertion efficiency factor YidD [Bacteroidota bacterium]